MDMVRDAVLTELKTKSQELFQKKQEAWNIYAEARDRVTEAHERMLKCWDERTAKREKMNEEYTELQKTIEASRLIWDAYGQVRDEKNNQIETLRAEAEKEHQQMVHCFNQASNEYEKGDKAMAPVFAEEGRKHQERRNSLNAEINSRIQEIREAKQKAKDTAPKADSAAFNEAKSAFEVAKNQHDEAQETFKRLKSERDEAKQRFDDIQAEYLAIKNEFQTRLDVLKAEAKAEREQMLETAGVENVAREDAKIVKKADGSVQIYTGGIGRADGFGHGHIALNNVGHKIYERKAFEPHGSQNYTDGGKRCLA